MMGLRILEPDRLRIGVLVGLAGGLGFTLAFALFFQLVRLYDSTVPRAAWPVIVLAFALAWLVVGLTFTLVDLGPDRERVAPGSPSQIIATSGRIALGVGLAAGLTAGLIAPWAARVGGFGRELSGLGVGLTAGLTSAVTLAIAFGLGAVIFQYSFRLWLRAHDVSPLRWVTFLDWTTENLLLRGTGPAYSWIHIQLRDYLADQFAETNKNWASAFHGGVTFPGAVGVIVFVVLVLVWFFFLLGTKW